MNEAEIATMLTHISGFINTRRIIEHGSIRCLDEPKPEREWAAKKLGIGIGALRTIQVGDEDASEWIHQLSRDTKRLSSVFAPSNRSVEIEELVAAYRGNNISHYVTRDKDNQLLALDELIRAAQGLINPPQGRTPCTILLSADPNHFGIGAISSQDQMRSLHSNLEISMRQTFSRRCVLTFQQTDSSPRKRVDCADLAIAEELEAWIDSNWNEELR